MRAILLSSVMLFITPALAQDFNIDGVGVSVGPDGSITGSFEDTFPNSDPDLPDSTASSSYTGQIGEDGSVTGSYSGSLTEFSLDESESVTSSTSSFSGTFTGEIDDSGSYSVSWDGDRRGAISGGLGEFGGLPDAPEFDAQSEPEADSGMEMTRSVDEIESESQQRFATRTLPLSRTQRAVRERVRVIQKVEDSGAFCGALSSSYRVDCLADRYSFIARTLPRDRESEEVREALSEAATKLRGLTRANQDTEKRRIMPRTAPGSEVRAAASRPYRPIADTQLEEALAEATTIVEELETVLLRSAENSERQKLYFSQMAQAVESNKVLLRSS